MIRSITHAVGVHFLYLQEHKAKDVRLARKKVLAPYRFALYVNLECLRLSMTDIRSVKEAAP